MILITGATGNLGGATIDFLLAKGVRLGTISALVRERKKADDLLSKGIIVMIGDYDDFASLVKAFKGVHKLLFVSGTDPEDRGKQHENVIKAAKEAGVKHILYNSYERKNETENSPVAFMWHTHSYTEKLIKESGIPYTIFRTNIYTELLPVFLGEKVSEGGAVFPAGETPAAFTLCSDIAEAMANVLMNEGHENKEYFLSNTENMSMRQIADALSELSGKTIIYNSSDTQTYINAMSDAGIPREHAVHFAEIAEGIKQGEFYSEKTDLENLLQRKPSSVKEFLKQVYFSKN
jgi:NAD(P)H dehydrogenase (quinone)